MQNEPAQSSIRKDPDLKSSAFKERTGLTPIFGPNGPGMCEDGSCPHVFELPTGDIRIVGSQVSTEDSRKSLAGANESAVDIPREFFERFIKAMKEHPTNEPY